MSAMSDHNKCSFWVEQEEEEENNGWEKDKVNEADADDDHVDSSVEDGEEEERGPGMCALFGQVQHICPNHKMVILLSF